MFCLLQPMKSHIHLKRRKHLSSQRRHRRRSQSQPRGGRSWSTTSNWKGAAAEEEEEGESGWMSWWSNIYSACGGLSVCHSDGWVQDRSGQWIKDENVEFDSDEEEPPSLSTGHWEDCRPVPRWCVQEQGAMLFQTVPAPRAKTLCNRLNHMISSCWFCSSNLLLLLLLFTFLSRFLLKMFYFCYEKRPKAELKIITKATVEFLVSPLSFFLQSGLFLSVWETSEDNPSLLLLVDYVIFSPYFPSIMMMY